MASKVVKAGTRYIRPVLSTNHTEAKRRVLNLYKAWYRQIPYILVHFDVPLSKDQCRDKLREKILENKQVTDLRAIDLLVIKGQNELVETLNIWKQKNHLMNYFGTTVNPKPKDFLSKFYEGHDP